MSVCYFRVLGLDHDKIKELDKYDFNIVLNEKMRNFERRIGNGETHHG